MFLNAQAIPIFMQITLLEDVYTTVLSKLMLTAPREDVFRHVLKLGLESTVPEDV